MSRLRLRLARESLQGDDDLKGVRQSWDEMLGELEEYHAEHQHCLVETHATKLGRWVSTQRLRYHKNELDPSQIRALESIGFVWKLMDKSPAQEWDEMFQELKQFKAQEGHCNVPTLTTKLGRWVSTQRSRRYGDRSSSNGGHKPLTQEQIGRLDEIGFVWRLKECDSGPRLTWDEMYDLLLDYKRQRGHCLVPARTEGKLGTWVSIQRRRYEAVGTNSKLTDEQVEKLDAIGFTWQVNSPCQSWDEMYSELQEYFETQGHTKVPSSYGKLGDWVSRQRMLRRRTIQGSRPITEEQIKLLDELSFVWDAQNYDERWNERYLELMDYREAHGDCRVPTNSGQLGKWVKVQRQCRDRRSGSNRQLTKEQIGRLDAIGFAWRADENIETWESMYEKLKAYKSDIGHCFVPQSQGKLGRWVDVQRRRLKGPYGRQKQLTEEEVRLLKELGFAWNKEERFQQIWDLRYKELFEFVKKYSRLPRRSDPCYKWLDTQRQRGRGGKAPLTVDQIERLDMLGLEWRPMSQKRSAKEANAGNRKKQADTETPRGAETKRKRKRVSSESPSRRSGPISVPPVAGRSRLK